MKKKLFSPALLITLVLSSLIFVQCQKEELIQDELEKTEYNTIYSVNANLFLQTMEADDTDFDGIFVKIREGEPYFEKVATQNHLFIQKDEIDQSLLKKMIISDNGEIENHDAARKDQYSIIDFPVDYDLVYFSWKDLKLIANNSQEIYFSGFKLDYGPSIHNGQEENISGTFNTLKVEGDFLKASESAGQNAAPTPMYSIAKPCPPLWKPAR